MNRFVQEGDGVFRCFGGYEGYIRDCAIKTFVGWCGMITDFCARVKSDRLVLLAAFKIEEYASIILEVETGLSVKQWVQFKSAARIGALGDWVVE